MLETLDAIWTRIYYSPVFNSIRHAGRRNRLIVDFIKWRKIESRQAVLWEKKGHGNSSLPVPMLTRAYNMPFPHHSPNDHETLEDWVTCEMCRVNRLWSDNPSPKMDVVWKQLG